MKYMHLILITEAPVETLSGASIYHRRIVDAWEQLGGTAELVGLDRPIDAGFAESISPDTTVIIEGAAFRLAEAAIGALQARGAAALIHHPTALEPGTPAELRDAMKALERRVLPQFRRVVAVSSPIATRLAQEFGVDPNLIRVVNPGIDRQKPITIDPMRPDGSLCRLLSLGTMTYRKGHDVLLNALATLDDLNWHLTLAGAPRDPQYLASIEALIEQLGIGHRVALRGGLTGAELEAAWRETEIFALATRFEGFGIAIAEAIARGLPVAITDGGAAASLVPSACGIVAPVDDAAQLGKALRRLVFSPKLRAEIGEAAHLHAQNYADWRQQAERLRIALG